MSLVGRVARRVYKEALRSANRLTLRHPALGLWVGGHLGAAAALHRHSWRASAAGELTAIFGPMEAVRIRRIRRQMGGQLSQNEALVILLREGGIEPLLPLITTIHAEPLLRLRAAGVPVVVVAWHHGPYRAASLALWRLGVPTLFGIAARDQEPDSDDGVVRYVELQGGVGDARFLKRAHRALADGMVVGLDLDNAPTGQTVSFLGRRILYARGAAFLARIAGARMVPVTRRFQDLGGRIEVTFHEPIEDADLDRSSGAAFEAALLARAAERFEAEARKYPESLRTDRVDWLLNEPLDGARGEAFVDADIPPREARRRQQRRDEKRLGWEDNWRSSEFDPPWRGRPVSAEIQQAVSSGWFAPGSRALDVGCGEGEVAAWLAQSGFQSVGVDIAESAVAHARRTFGERPGSLRFDRVDVCERAPEGGPFAVVVDRGCFLQIAADERRGYAANLASACTGDARLLVYGRAFRDGIPFGDPAETRRRRRELMSAFGPHFEIERGTPTYLDRYHGERPEHRLPGLVWWLCRRPP